MSESIAEIGERFFAEYEERNSRLVQEFSLAWKDLEGLTQPNIRGFDLAGWERPHRGKMASLTALVDGPGREFLLDLVGRYRKTRPQARALAAIEDYETGITDLLRQVPETAMVSGRELSDIARARGSRSWWTVLLRGRRRPRPFRLRTAMRNSLALESLRRGGIDGHLLLHLARTSLALVRPWQILRQESLRVLRGQDPDVEELKADREAWLRLVTPAIGQMEGVIDLYESWKGNATARLASSLLRGDSEPGRRRRTARKERWQSRFSYWSRQQRAVDALIELETTLTGLLLKSVELSEQSLLSLDAEYSALLDELDKAELWLREWQEGLRDRPFPPPEAKLLSAEDRTSEWARRISTVARSQLPFNVESLEPRRAFPRGRPPWRQLETEETFLESIGQVGRPKALDGFLEAEASHFAIVREVERAREVAAFSLEAAEAGDEEGLAIAGDGIGNALSLLAYQKKNAIDPRPVVEEKLVECLAASFFESHLALERGRLGLLTHLVRQRGVQILRLTGALAVRQTRAAVLWTWRAIVAGYRNILARAGWAAPPAGAPEPVARRPYAGEAMKLRAAGRELPPIYRRLFRLEPLEDPRFLVGRESETNALADARRLWEAERAVSILVVGARGSGKTSLLNCAVSSVLSGLPVVNGSFNARIRSAAQMRAFLAELLGTEPGNLENELSSHRRVVLLEEGERTYLRTVGGFLGLRSLLDLISHTSHRTLWILSMNELAYRFLDRVVGLEGCFSHRINAMAVQAEHLKGAILMRHNLSGLRLQFAARAPAHPRLERVRQTLGLTPDPEQAFFDLLYSQSRGIFRSAFELWQRSIDRVEGGVLYMQDPGEPANEAVISTLTLDDSFTLQAVLQHGSLTPEELSSIFDCGLSEAVARLDRLAACEILEPDPRSPGLRVSPHAGRIVRDALHRQNLL